MKNATAPTKRNCSELRGSADYSAYCGGAAKHEFPKQTVAVPSNVNSYDETDQIDTGDPESDTNSGTDQYANTVTHGVRAGCCDDNGRSGRNKSRGKRCGE